MLFKRFLCLRTKHIPKKTILKNERLRVKMPNRKETLGCQNKSKCIIQSSFKAGRCDRWLELSYLSLTISISGSQILSKMKRESRPCFCCQAFQIWLHSWQSRAHDLDYQKLPECQYFSYALLHSMLQIRWTEWWAERRKRDGNSINLFVCSVRFVFLLFLLLFRLYHAKHGWHFWNTTIRIYPLKTTRNTNIRWYFG